MKIKRYAVKFLLPVLYPLVKLYWRVFKPKTFGVRVLVLHPHEPGKILLIRHAYGNRSLWNIPGGGYKPRKEDPLQAARREIREEFGKNLLDALKIGEYQTSGEGKLDTVVLIVGTFDSDKIVRLDPEIAEMSWEGHKDILARDDVARVVKQAIRLGFTDI
jgi:8-oxo-dGTP pyrophosphatase MutT (NUDIX family)